MKNLISFERATQLSINIFGFFILFHFLIIVGIVLFNYVPIDYLWGGRFETKDQLLMFEIISLIIQSICLVVVLIKSQKLAVPKLIGISGVILWLLVVLFVLNTIGNILAETTFEKFFAIITLILSFLCLRLALEK